LAVKFRTAFAQQLVQRLLAGKAGYGSHIGRGPPRQTQVGRAHAGRDHIPGVFFGLAVLLIDTERTGQIGIELARRRRGFADIALLRCLAEAAGHRGAGPVRAGEVGSAVEGIVGRGFEPRLLLLPSPLWGRVGGGNAGLRSHARAALTDGGIEQIRQRRIERRRVRTRRLGARRLGRVFFRMLCRIAPSRGVPSIGTFRHGLNMGRVR